MIILPSMSLNFNESLRIIIDEENISSGSILLLIKEFSKAVGIEKLLAEHFKTDDNSIRLHTDFQNLLQVILELEQPKKTLNSCILSESKKSKKRYNCSFNDKSLFKHKTFLLINTLF